jgi:transcription-repair coupling factor (superfamily II helicase)
MKALKESEALGSGYRIALKDLEIRGTGNILGKEQSGNINQVGLNLYCQILSEAIEKLNKDAKVKQ